MPDMAMNLQRLAGLVGGLLLLSAAPALAQSPPILSTPPSPTPTIVTPLLAPTPDKTVPPAPEPLIADSHVASTKLGFDKGIGPAVGRTITYRDKQYEVIDVAVVGGGPSFSGGSRFAIAPAGRELVIGLKAVEPTQVAALQK